MNLEHITASLTFEWPSNLEPMREHIFHVRSEALSVLDGQKIVSAWATITAHTAPVAPVLQMIASTSDSATLDVENYYEYDNLEYVN